MRCLQEERLGQFWESFFEKSNALPPDFYSSIHTNSSDVATGMGKAVHQPRGDWIGRRSYNRYCRRRRLDRQRDAVADRNDDVGPTVHEIGREFL